MFDDLGPLVALIGGTALILFIVIICKLAGAS